MEGSPNKNYTIKDNRASSGSAWDILSNMSDAERNELNDKMLNIDDWQRSGRIDEARAQHLREEVTRDAKDAKLQDRVRDYNESQAENMYQNWQEQSGIQEETPKRTTVQDQIRDYNESQAENMYQNWQEQSGLGAQEESPASQPEFVGQPPAAPIEEPPVPQPENQAKEPNFTEPQSNEVDKEAILDYLLGSDEPKPQTPQTPPQPKLNLNFYPLGDKANQAEQATQTAESQPKEPEEPKTIDEAIEARKAEVAAEETAKLREQLTNELNMTKEADSKLRERLALEEQLFAEKSVRQRQIEKRRAEIQEELEEIRKMRENLPHTTSTQSNTANLQQGPDIAPPPLNREDLNAIIGETQDNDTESEATHRSQEQGSIEQEQKTAAEQQAAERKNFSDTLVRIAHANRIGDAEGFAKVFLDTEPLDQGRDSEFTEYWNSLSDSDRTFILGFANEMRNYNVSDATTSTFLTWLTQKNLLS